jgi:HEAT repeat protein
MLAFVIASNPVVNIAWWIGTSFIALSFFVIVFMIMWRHWLALTNKKNQIVSVERDRVFIECLASNDEKHLEFLSFQNSKTVKSSFNFSKLKTLSNDQYSRPQILKNLLKYDPSEFLYLWNYLHDSVRGDSTKKLNLIAESIDLKAVTIKSLDNRQLKRRLLAISSLGHLQDQSSINELAKRTNLKDPIVSFWATKALLRINFEANSERFLPLIALRRDWSSILVAEMLKEFGADKISIPLVKLVENCYKSEFNERQMSRVISYLSLAHPTDYTDLILKILKENDQTEIVIACLRLVFTAEALPLVRKYFKDERWQVRMQVVLTLARIGHSEDTNFIILALNDLDWWVRYRAACALPSMPAMTQKRLKKLSKTLPNQFSRDIICHVLAELRLKCFLQPSSFTLSK